MSLANGPRKFRMVPYTLSVAHRKIGNRPAQYIIRSPPRPQNNDPPPVLQPYGEGDYTEEVADPEIQIVHEEPGCSYEATVDEALPEESLQAELTFQAEEEPQEDPNLPSSSKGTSSLAREVIVHQMKQPDTDLRFKYPACYVEAHKRWTYKTDDDGQYFYSPNPFKPGPAIRGAPCAAIRMHYAAKRIDSCKYKAQEAVADAAKQQYMESAICEKCNMRFFLPMSQMRSQISYGVNHYQALSFFACPMCLHDNQIIDSNKEYDY